MRIAAGGGSVILMHHLTKIFSQNAVCLCVWKRSCSRRPIALKSGGIGVWDNVLQLMTLIAVITNCALIGVTSTRWWPDDVSPATQILVVVIVEHVILFLKV